MTLFKIKKDAAVSNAPCRRREERSFEQSHFLRDFCIPCFECVDIQTGA